MSLRTGISDLNNPDFTVTDPESGDELQTRLETKSAWLIAGEIGYDFGPVRFGVDLSYSRNKVRGLDLRSVNGTAITADDVEDIVDTLIDAEILYPEDFEGAEIDGTTIRSTSGSIAKLRQIGVMANLTYDIPVSDTIRPYVGVGLGAVGTHVKALGEDDGSIRFAWQARAGVAFQLSPAVALTADYTYRQASAGRLQFGDGEVEYRLGKTKASQIAAGVRFTF
ncbi:P44/Msp2 family outer membrane protein [Novosphingobium guangzhouense]|uniref:P44/Msp2 family outer membrane protein n=1 Tax=Novosphingobium guangzhouense TaxID=1850347 RepID=A0A2K2FV03_9SPHN|nr:P44/Msp2 family outer membrane protein [Novosphingobium guangzhouense]